VKKTGSTSYGYVGGFVGDLGGGPVADSYARGTVDADGSGYAGGFAGQINSNARVFTTYCSAPVTTGSSYYVGAFGGYVNGDRIVTNSYHHAVDARLARGQNGSSAAYVGIMPVATADMTKRASFPAFDFTETWLIDEGESMPYLKCFESYEIDSFAVEWDPSKRAEPLPEYNVDKDTGRCTPGFNPVPDHMFFKYRMQFDN
jgi:hypothetical protein